MCLLTLSLVLCRLARRVLPCLPSAMADAMASASAPSGDQQLKISFHHVDGFKNSAHRYGRLRLVAASISTGDAPPSVVAHTWTQGKCFNETYTVPWTLGCAMSVQLQSVGLVQSVCILAEAHIPPSALEVREISRSTNSRTGPSPSVGSSWARLLCNRPCSSHLRRGLLPQLRILGVHQTALELLLRRILLPGNTMNLLLRHLLQFHREAEIGTKTDPFFRFRISRTFKKY